MVATHAAYTIGVVRRGKIHVNLSIAQIVEPIVLTQELGLWSNKLSHNFVMGAKLDILAPFIFYFLTKKLFFNEVVKVQLSFSG